MLNDVGYTQISVAFGDDATTRDVTARIIADGKVWMSGSRWQGRDVLRISVSNWTTDADDVDTAVEAVGQALEAVRARLTAADAPTCAVTGPYAADRVTAASPGSGK